MAMGSAFAVLLVLAALFSVAPLGTTTEIAVIAAAVAVISWWSTPGAAVTVGLVAFLFVSGFVFGQEGALTWDGEIDALLLLALVSLALSASVVHRPHHAHRSRAIPGGRIHG